MLLGVGAATANPPGWQITASASLPTVVSPGAVAGYSFTITNNGTSNISQLYLTAGYPAVYFQTPVYFHGSTDLTGSSDPCLVLQYSPTLYCSVGALNAGDRISFVVAFTASMSGTFNPGLQFNTSGATTSDGSKKTSHGDSLNVPVSTSIDSSGDFAGTFTPDNPTAVQTNQSVGRNNPQATSIYPPSAHIPVTADDSGNVTFDCSSSPSCANLFGVWSAINVNNNAPYSGDAFQVTLLLYGKAVPSGVSTSDIKVIHVLNDGTVETLNQTDNACPADPGTTTADCIQSVSKVGPNYLIVLWLIQNGGLHSSY
jgi:hypothetical protein